MEAELAQAELDPAARERFEWNSAVQPVGLNLVARSWAAVAWVALVPTADFATGRLRTLAQNWNSAHL